METPTKTQANTLKRPLELDEEQTNKKQAQASNTARVSLDLEFLEYGPTKLI
jgi:hypothetical protein